MKFVSFLVCLIVVAGCATTPNLSGRYPFEVEKISGAEYYIEFYGTPLTTFEEAREEWHNKAKGVCLGDYQYKKGKTAGICEDKNALSCIEKADELLDSGPVIKGVALCTDTAIAYEPKIIYATGLDGADPEEIQEILIVKQLESDTFFIEFAGLPDGSIDDARDKWHMRAGITCKGNEYDHKFSKNSMWQADLTPTGEGISVKHNVSGGGDAGAMGAACAVGGAIGCMIASLIFSNSSEPTTITTVSGDVKPGDEVRFPVVEGRVFCK